MKIDWPDDNLQVFLRDEIEILRGVGDPNSDLIIATAIRNNTKGTFCTSVEGLIRTRKPQNYIPPLPGYVTNIEIGEGTIRFDLIENSPPK